MKISIFIFLIALTISSHAQIVNIENMRLASKPQGLTGSVDLNVNFTMNTVQLLNIGDRARIGYRKNQHYLLLLTDHSFIRTNSISIVNLGFEHVRYTYTLKDSGKIAVEAFEQAQFNKIQKINLRLLLGGGFRFHLLDQKNYQLNFGSGCMFEYEELIDYGLSNDVLSNNYLSFDGQFNDIVGLNTISYFQPKLIDFGNYRFANETQIRLKINKYLTYRIIYFLSHDSRDINEVRKTNYTFKNALSFTF